MEWLNRTGSEARESNRCRIVLWRWVGRANRLQYQASDPLVGGLVVLRFLGG